MKFKLSDLKTTGVEDERGVKNFMITTPLGDRYIAIREGSGFTIGDDATRRTLKQCKELVANDAVVYFADAEKAPEVPQTWDHVDPCALLVLLECPRSISEEVHRTLDANGWIKPDGTQDIELARKTFEQERSK